MSAPTEKAIIVFIDDDGDEFRIMRFLGESLERVEQAAQHLVAEGDWCPAGVLSLARYREEEE
jgi:hypothetical protein